MPWIAPSAVELPDVSPRLENLAVPEAVAVAEPSAWPDAWPVANASPETDEVPELEASSPARAWTSAATVAVPAAAPSPSRRPEPSAVAVELELEEAEIGPDAMTAPATVADPEELPLPEPSAIADPEVAPVPEAEPVALANAREVADVVDEPAELAIGRPIASMSPWTVAVPTLAPGE
jgi:hypothetical protein